MNNKIGREPYQVVELYQERCAHVYGELPCTASGANKCYNTRKTCQDPINYLLGEPLIIRFNKPQVGIPLDEYIIPSLRSVSTSPTRINAGGQDPNASSLGQRAQCSMTFQDHPHNDRLVDPYVEERTFDPFLNGTFWSKWIARNPYYAGILVRVYDGYLGEQLSEMMRRTYVLERLSGPDASGRVSLVAKDPLVLADKERSLAPRPSDLRLAESITISQTTEIKFIGAETDIAEQLGTTGETRFVRIEDEIISYTGYTVLTEEPFLGQLQLSGVTRARLGTPAAVHDADEAGQRAIRYVLFPVHQIINDLLLSYTNVTSDFIPFAAWENEFTEYLPAYSLTATIAEPIPVSELIAELSEQCMFYIWWDERDELIKFRAIRPPADEPVLFTDKRNIVESSFKQEQKPDQRVSRIFIYYNERNPTEDQDKFSNYGTVSIAVDAEVEQPELYGESRTKQIFSRWLVTEAQAFQAAVRLLRRYKDTPTYVTVRVDAKDRNTWTGDLVDLKTRNIVDFNGFEIERRFEVISAEEVVQGEVVEYKMVVSEFLVGARYGVYMEFDAPVYTLASEVERNNGGWLSDDEGLMSNGDDGYRLQ